MLVSDTYQLNCFKFRRFIMKITSLFVLAVLAIALTGCGDVSVTTTSAGGSSAAPEPVVVEPTIVEVEK